MDDPLTALSHPSKNLVGVDYAMLFHTRKPSKSSLFLEFPDQRTSDPIQDINYHIHPVFVVAITIFEFV